MNLANRLVQSGLNRVVLIILALGLILAVGGLLGVGQEDIVLRGAQLVLFGILALLVLRQPYLGVVVTVASLPVLDILPVIPFATSAVALVGAITLIAYLAHLRWSKSAEKFSFPKGLWWGVLFLAWIFVSNPAAAMLPDDDGRLWAFTFAQVIILAWLAGQLLDTPRKHHILMWVFSALAVLSAIYAVGGAAIGETIKVSVRSVGLVGGENAAARYFVVALAFLLYLWTTTQKRIVHILMLLAMAILVYGTMSTVSRTGLLLLGSMIGMLFIQRSKDRQQFQVVLISVIVVGVIWFLAENMLAILRSVLPSIQQGTDTVGLRYALWKAGFRMWQDHLLTGVGIGQYTQQLPVYAGDLLAPRYWGLGAHNMYVAVLAETGMVGLALFGFLLVATLLSLIRATRLQDANLVGLGRVWLMVFVIMLIGGITKHDHYDKLVWLSLGVGLGEIWRQKGTWIKSAPSE